MKRSLPAFAAITLLAAPVFADDARIGTRLYDPARVVTLGGQIGYQSTIEFAADERIENIAIGDSSAWQVTPNKRASLLFLKPVLANVRTNMTVVTSKRTYLFDLVPQRAGTAAIYALRFTYPEPISPLIEEGSTIKPEVAAATAPDEKPLDPASLNFAWTGKGDRALLPQRSFDDGKSLYLAWDKGIDLPAILAPGPNGSEGPVNFAMQGDYLVIAGVPDRITLRSGKLIAMLANARPQRTAPDLAMLTKGEEK